MIARQTFHLQCRGTRTTGTHVEHINYAYAALASQPAWQSQFICCFSCLPAANAKRSDATRLHFTRLDSRAYSLPAIHHFSWRWHFHLFQQTNTSNNSNVDKSIFMATPSSLFFLPLPHWPVVPFCPFLCWLRAVKFISFNINWQHENLFINCSFSLLYPVKELCEGVTWCEK